MAIAEKYRQIVKNSTLAAGGIGVIGAFMPAADLAAMTTLWVKITLDIAEKSGHKLDQAYATKMVTAVLTGVAGYVGGSKILTWVLQGIPVANLAGMGINAGLNALYTYRMGHALSSLFDKGSFDMSDYATTAVYMLSLLAGIPRPEEIGDFIAIIAN